MGVAAITFTSGSLELLVDESDKRILSGIDLKVWSSASSLRMYAGVKSGVFPASSKFLSFAEK